MPASPTQVHAVATEEIRMPQETPLAAVGHAIQLSVAPVFLLTAIGTLLNVLANRLARVIDRARAAEGRVAATRPEEQQELHALLATLARRARLINRAITLITITALFVCVVVAALFIGALSPFPVASLVAVLFVSAMLTMVAGLLSFLREIFVATASLRIGVLPHGATNTSSRSSHSPSQPGQ
jgi:hypothetical protein